MTVKGNYGVSSGGNFKVVDTIDVPHPFCITAGHVSYASERGVILTREIIKRSGIDCGVRGCNLSIDDHEEALLIGCNAEIKGEDGKANPELHEYLLSIKEECEKNGYAGFAFKRGF